MNSKEFLMQFRNQKHMITSLIDEYHKLRSLSTSIKSIQFDSDKIQSSHEDKLIQILNRLMDLENQIKQEADDLIFIQRTVRDAIENSDTNSKQEKQLLRNYFINEFSWNQCANVMDISERHVHRLKQKALKNFKIPEHVIECQCP